MAQTLAQLGDGRLQQDRGVFGHETKQVEESHVLGVRAVGEEGHQRHHVVVDQLLVHRVDGGQDPGQTEVAGDDAVKNGLDVSGEDVSVLDDSKAHVGGQVPGQVLVALVEELDGHGDGLYHDVPLAVVEEDAGHDVTGHLGMGRISTS